MGFRTRPPAVVEGPIGCGYLDLPQACARAKRLATRPFKFTLTGPHMLAKTLVDNHYKNLPDLAMALGAALAEQVRHLDADVVQIDEANLPGSPDEWPWAAAAMNRVLDAVKRFPPSTCASVIMAASRFRRANGLICFPISMRFMPTMSWTRALPRR